MTVFFPQLQEIERHRIIMSPHRLRLNRLEKPENWGERLWSKVALACAGVSFQQYPSYQPFYERIARRFEVDVDALVVGAGIEEFVRSFMILHAGKRVAVSWPTCAMFEIYARAFGVELVKLDGLAVLDVAAVLLVNPSQPFDDYYDRVQVRAFAGDLQRHGILLAVDEAYHGFGADTALGLHLEFDNVLVMRSFSKAWGAAGIRVGWAVGSPSIVRALHAIRPSGEVSAHSMAVATALMDAYNPHVIDSIEEVTEGRDYLRKWCEGNSLHAIGSFGNFVTIRVPCAVNVAAGLADRGVLVRVVDNEHIMVTCGSVRLMKEFTDALAY